MQRKDKIKAEMDEVLGYLELYKESFPENPAFAAGGAKKAKKPEAAPQQVVASVVVEPAVDVSKVVEDALGLVADSVIFGYLNGENPLPGVDSKTSDALAHLTHVWAALTHGAGSWSSAKGNFVDTFSRLVNKSATQVGTHTSKSFSDIHAFLTNVASTEGESLLAKTRSADDVHKHHGHCDAKHDSKEEEKVGGAIAGTSSEEHSPEAVAETAGEGHKEHKDGEDNQEGGAKEFRGGNRRGGRGGYRGNNFRKHNHDEEGFQVVKPDAAHHNHYNTRRGGQRGGNRGGRGGNRGGEGGDHGAHQNHTQRGGGRGGHRGEGRPWTHKEHRAGTAPADLDAGAHQSPRAQSPKGA